LERAEKRIGELEKCLSEFKEKIDQFEEQSTSK